MRYARPAMNERVRPLPSTSEPQTRQEPEVERLERALREIRSDARARSPRYLDDTVVPEGGE